MSLGLDKLSSRYVYRVLRPDEDHYKDLTCKDSSSKRSLAQHVETGLRIHSQYISTTCSLEKAKKWLETADEKTSQKYGNKRTTVVKIDVSQIKSKYPQIARSAIDLTKVTNRNYFLENEAQKRFAGFYEEVVFLEQIPSEVVTVEHVKGRYGRHESLISRPPRYVPLDNNIGVNNSSLVSDSSLHRRYGSDAETDSYPSFTNRFSSQNTYEPYTIRSMSQSTYPKSRIDDDTLSAFGDLVFAMCIPIVFIVCVLVACSPVICCCCVLARCLGVFGTGSESTRYSNLYRSLTELILPC